MQTQTNKLGIFAVLILLMAVTRGSHFGSSLSLPDATLAIFLVAGFMLPRFSLISVAAFTFLLLEAGGIDYYVINVNGVSDYCISPAYGFLIPTYASMWFAGHWFAARKHNNLSSLALFGGVAWLSSSVAFLISNSSFYALSGRFTDMAVVEYAARVAQYYMPYVGGSLMYLAIAAAIYTSFNQLQKSSKGTAQH